MQQIIRYIQKFEISNMPDEMLKRAKYILLDSIGGMFSPNKSDNYSTTFWSGVRLVECEKDEGNAFAKGHPACHFLPSLLQIAKNEDKTYDEVLEAFVVGYEVGARFGEIITLKPLIHPHGNWGIIGGAAALAKLKNWNSEQTKQAILISAQLSYPTLWKSVLEGHEVRNLIIGYNNMNLLLLPEIIDAGYSASEETLTIIFNDILGTQLDIDNWNIDSTTSYFSHAYFKFYDSCRFCHGPIDAIKKVLLKVNPASKDEIVSITIETYESAARLNDKQPRNAFAGKFSIPYSMAKEICVYFNEPYDEKNVYEIAEKIEVISSEELNKLLPAIRATKCSVKFRNQEVVVEIQGALGEENLEQLQTLIEDKFINQLSTYFDETTIKRWIDQIIVQHVLPYEELI
ncbi:MmgE/PrpD family protein [Solibacillus sp. FSL H8-0523]|uniref:MmgE/PrpD family protein n=1 Tax=Solibacillus sp. FSL H8-0523 TaxID=2954511 RepID=UPI00310118B0